MTLKRALSEWLQHLFVLVRRYEVMSGHGRSPHARKSIKSAAPNIGITLLQSLRTISHCLDSVAPLSLIIALQYCPCQAFWAVASATTSPREIRHVLVWGPPGAPAAGLLLSGGFGAPWGPARGKERWQGGGFLTLVLEGKWQCS